MTKKIMIIFLTICVLILLGIIFIFSDQNAEESGNVSQKTTKSIGHKIKEWPVFRDIKNRVDVTEVNYFVRKCAHFSLYMMLGILLMCMLTVFETREKQRVLISLGTGIVYAILDEFHQWFVPGREARVTDVAIDTFGVIIGIIVIFTLKKFLHNMRKKV